MCPLSIFNVNPHSNIKMDDARHALKTLKKKYDIITFDLFLSEIPPSHLLTIETFKEVQAGLKPRGIFGFTSGDLEKASRSVYKTPIKSGFKTKMCVTPSNNEMGRNLIFLASKSNLDFTHTTYSEPFMYPVTNLEEHFLNTAEMDFTEDIILTDDVPVMEHLYANAALEWRKASNLTYAEKFIANL